VFDPPLSQLWEEDVFSMMQPAFTDLLSIFTYYAYAGSASDGSATSWSTDTLQQTELVDLALDCGLATKQFSMAKVVALFEAENARNGAADADLELFEFLQLVVVLAHKRANPTGTEGVPLSEALWQMIAKHLSRSARLAELQPLVRSLKADVATSAVLRVHEAALKSFFSEAMPRVGAAMPEQVFLQQLNAAGLMRGAIVTLPAEALAELPAGTASEVRCDLLWLDVSAAYHACASSEAGLLVADYASCLALLGMIKYAHVEPMSIVQQVAGFLANLAGRMDEADVVKTAFARGGMSPRGAPPARVSPRALAATLPVDDVPPAAPTAVPRAVPLGAASGAEAVGAVKAISALMGGGAAPAPSRPPKAPSAVAPSDAKANKARPPSPRGAKPADAAAGAKSPRAAKPADAAGGAKARSSSPGAAVKKAAPAKAGAPAAKGMGAASGAEAVGAVKAASAFMDAADGARPTGNGSKAGKGARPPSPRGARPKA
jgi:hypothetical protein